MRYNAVIFDMDGTLVDSLKGIRVSINAALKSIGYPEFPMEDYLNGVGGGIKKLLEYILRNENVSKKQINEIIKVCLPLYKGAGAMKLTVPYDGIMELLHKLRDNGIKTAVLTNKDHRVTTGVVKECLFDFPFDAVRGFIDGKPNKPNPKAALEVASAIAVPPQNILFVGDSDIDMITATGAGMTPVGVGWGYRSREELSKSGAAHILEKPSDLLDIILNSKQ